MRDMSTSHTSSILLIRNSRFLKLWLGQLFSQSCTRMYQIAILWWLLSTQPLHAGKISALFLILGALPSILFVRLIGKWVDQLARKKILITADLCASVIVGGISIAAYLDFLTLPWIYCASFLLALSQAFYEPTLFKALPDLVEQKDLKEAVAWHSSTQSIASFGGAILGVVLIETWGVQGVALLNTFGYLFALFCNLGIQFEKNQPLPCLSSTKGTLSLEDFFKKQPLFRRLLIGFAFINFFSMPTLILLPLFVQKTLHRGASTLSQLEAALWLGLVLGTLCSKFFGASLSPVRAGALALLQMGICIGLLTVLIHPDWSMVCLFLSGSFLGLNNTKFIGFFQSEVPEAIKGRFFAVLQAGTTVATPLAYFVFGLLSDWTGPVALILLQSLGIIGVSSFFFKLSVSVEEAPLLAEGKL